MFDEYKIPKGTLDGRIRKNVMHRQALKKKWDRHCKYDASADNANVGATFAIDKFSEDKENWVRLLDEGVVVEGDSTPYAVIGKGVIKKWFDELPKDFEGYINKDHISGIDLGKFKKSDLRIVELGDDRYGVDVNVKLDHELYATKDLLRSMNRKAISSEFYYDADEYVKASVATGDTSFPDWFLIPKISEISLVGYAVVDNPKNANSYDEDLLKKASADEEEGKNTMSEEEKKRLEAEGEIENEETEAVAEETEVEETADAGEDEGEKEQNSAAGEEAETETEAEGEADAEEEAEVEDAGDGEGESEVEDEKSDEEGESTVDQLAAAIKSLKAENEALKEENAELKAKLSTKEEKEADFETKLKNVLEMASTSEPTEEEGADVTPEEGDKEENSVVKAYKEAFNGLGE